MAPRRSTRIRTLRVLLLLAFFATLGGVAALLWPGREVALDTSSTESTAEIGEPSSDELTELLPANDEIVLEGAGFRQEITQEGRVVFAVEGERSLADEEDNVFLEGVRVLMSRENGEYVLTGGRGRFFRDRGEARVEGAVEVTGPDGLRVRTPWLDLGNGGDDLATAEGTEFELPGGLTGQAETLRMDLRRETSVLSGGVVLRRSAELGEPFRLIAEEITYRRRTGRVLAEGTVRFSSPRGDLRAERLVVWLGPDERLERVRAFGGVEGFVTRPPVAGGADQPSELQRLELVGEVLDLTLDVLEQPAEVVLGGSWNDRPRMTMLMATGGHRRFEAPRISGAFSEGHLATFVGRAPALLVETMTTESGDEIVARRLRARRIAGAFDDEQRLARIDLDDDVSMRDGEISARASRGRILTATRSANLYGAPVEITHPDGLLRASEVTVVDGDRLHAKGGVRVVLEDQADTTLAEATLGGGTGPVMVEANEAIIQRASGEALFKGDVKAWRGASRLLAQQLRTDREAGTLSASGAVRTSWSPAGAPAEGAGADASQPTRIAAELLTYRRSDGWLSYEQSVIASQPDRTVGCEHLEIELDERNEARRFECRGSVRVVEIDLGRRVEGDVAIYSRDARLVEVLGNVRLEDPEGLVVTGPYLWYSLDDGRVHMTEHAKAGESAG